MRMIQAAILNTGSGAHSAMRKLTAIDLFSGCGGLTLGLKQAGFRVLAAIEIDKKANETYAKNHSEVLLKRGNINRVPVWSIRDELKLVPGQLDLLAGCPPCQGFSVLRTQNGARSAEDKRNYLIYQMLRFARVLRPKALMMENVPKLRDHPSFDEFCDRLSSLGYRVIWAVKDAARYGVPQRRKRLILLAGLGFEIPFAHEAGDLVSVRQTIGGLDAAGASGDELHDLPERRAEHVRQLIRDIPKDGGSRGDLPDERQLECHQRQDGFHDIYGRMAWDDVAPTITSGCHNPSKGRFLHPVEDRAITLREAALLQGFPKEYRFPISAGKEAIALMIENALPPEFIRRHALSVRAALTSQARAT
jgi:DNA (cytosine-5)-methyltransferase 1